MNEKFDHIFRKIAQEHESPFEPVEWENFKKLLENDTPHTPKYVSPSTPANPIFLYKNWAKVSALAFLVYLLPFNLNDFLQNSQEHFITQNSLDKNVFTAKAYFLQKNNITKFQQKNPNSKQNFDKNTTKNDFALTQENQKNTSKNTENNIFANKNTNFYKNELITQTLPIYKSKENFVKNTKKENTKENTEKSQENTEVFALNLATISPISAKNTAFSLPQIPEILPIEIKGIELQKSPFISIKPISTPFNTKHAIHNIGIMNFASAKGSQFALLTNQNTFVTPTQSAEDMPIFEKRKFKAQVSTLLNLNSNDYQNLQLAFLFNGACHVKGLQLATANGASVVEGTQIGVVNVAKKLKGTQFGIVNIVDSVEKGVPIGVLSFVKHGGYQRLEISTGDVFQTNLLGKFGMKKLYNVFSAASGYGISQDFRWALGFGFGKEFTFTKKSALNTEFLAYHVNEQTSFTRELNLLTQFRIQYNFQIFKGTNLYFGPTINTMFSDFRNPDMTLGSQIAPYVIFQEKFKNSETSMKMWLGGNIGISF